MRAEFIHGDRTVGGKMAGHREANRRLIYKRLKGGTIVSACQNQQYFSLFCIII